MSFSFSAQDCALNPIGTDQSFSHPFNTISQRVSHVSNLSNSLRFHPYTMFDTSSIASMFKTFHLPDIHLSQSPLTGLSPHTNYSIKICRPMFSSHATSQPCYYVIWWLQVKNRGMSTTTDIKLSNWWQQTSPPGQPLRGATWLVTVGPLPSNRHHRSCGDRLEGKGENYQVCSVQYCVQQLCTVRCTHIWTD